MIFERFEVLYKLANRAQSAKLLVFAFSNIKSNQWLGVSITVID